MSCFVSIEQYIETIYIKQYIVGKDSRRNQTIVTFSHQAEIFEMKRHKMNVKILNQRIDMWTQICLKLLIKEWQILLFKCQVFITNISKFDFPHQKASSWIGTLKKH